MTTIGQPHTPESRDKARARLRTLTRGAVLAATGATVAIGIAVSHDHAGKASGSARSGSSGAGSTGTNVAGGGSSSLGNTGTTGNTGNTGSVSTAPSASSSTPTVTSGGSSA